MIVIKNPDDSSNYVKRITGMPNDSIKMSKGSVYINEKEQKEPYVYKGSFYEKEFFSSFSKRKIPLNQLFVMGDNSKDSRNGLECINKNNVVGVMFYKF